jgi:adenine-specific DNA-methyltransferase
MSDAAEKSPPVRVRRQAGGKELRAVVAMARKLRRTSTDVERILWHRIRDKQVEEFRFRRQRPVGNCIVDFVCLEAKLIVELDGGRHVDAAQADAARTQFLESLGYRVLRFRRDEVLENMEGLLQRVRETLLQPATSSPTCSARRPLHRATVRLAASMLAEIPASPPTFPLAGVGAGPAGANAGARTSSPAMQGEQPPGLRRAARGVRSPGRGAHDDKKGSIK